ncbi:MAG: type I restriction enzyme HsdR N-terminal domain-containing protein [Anaerolineaceae bacterium]|nr:type I restriction enzyme HsdR N-terminal domain-containing protein [Anaerolineaceae bacterium]MDE0327776.1 type I restriction enzyme HsdR N-terminal domain-containing protein [Anaerolineaceae bacterium]
MDFSDHFRKLADRLRERKPHVRSEEATKQSLVIPFIRDLGYDIYNPAEVVPEYIADVGTKKGEKVDYAILKDGRPIFLIECKDVSVVLGPDQRSQLTRYFMVTPDVRYAILTNGIVYQFFTELDEKNQMDTTPFLTIDMENLDGRHVRELERFTKDAFDADKIFSSARELRFMREIGERIAVEFREPSEQFVRHFAKQVYSKPLTQARMEEFARFVREALRAHVNDLVRARLQSAILSETEDATEESVPDSRRLDGSPDFSVYWRWKRVEENPELHRLFMEFYKFVRGLGENAWLKPSSSVFSGKRKRGDFFNIFYLNPDPRNNRLGVSLHLDPSTVQSVQPEEGFIHVLGDGKGYYNLDLTIRNHDDLERAKPLIKRSYDEAG